MSLKKEFRVGLAVTDLAFGQDCKALLPAPGVHPDYLLHAVEARSDDILRLVDEASHGTGRLQMSLLGAVGIRIPEPTEQRRIAALLNTLDAEIAIGERTVARYRSLRVALRDSLLEDGQAQLGSDRRSIGDLATYVGSGVTPRGGADVYEKEGVLFIRSQNVYSDGLRLDDVARIPVQVHREMARSALQPFDVLYNITGASIGRCTFLPSGCGPANVNQHVCVIRLPSAAASDATFVSAVLDSEIGKRQLRAFNAGSNREGLNYQQLRSFVIPWPSTTCRQRFTNVVAAGDWEIRAESARLAKLRALRSGLADDLLTGRVRTVPA